MASAFSDASCEGEQSIGENPDAICSFVVVGPFVDGWSAVSGRVSDETMPNTSAIHAGPKIPSTAAGKRRAHKVSRGFRRKCKIYGIATGICGDSVSFHIRMNGSFVSIRKDKNAIRE